MVNKRQFLLCFHEILQLLYCRSVERFLFYFILHFPLRQNCFLNEKWTLKTFGQQLFLSIYLSFSVYIFLSYLSTSSSLICLHLSLICLHLSLMPTSHYWLTLLSISLAFMSTSLYFFVYIFLSYLSTSLSYQSTFLFNSYISVFLFIFTVYISCFSCLHLSFCLPLSFYV